MATAKYENSLSNLIALLNQIAEKHGSDIPVSINLISDRVLALKSVCVDNSDPSEDPQVFFEADLEDRAECGKDFIAYEQVDTGTFQRLTTRQINKIAYIRNHVSLASHILLIKNGELQKRDIKHYDEENFENEENFKTIVEYLKNTPKQLLDDSIGIMLDDNEFIPYVEFANHLEAKLYDDEYVEVINQWIELPDGSHHRLTI